MNDEIVGDGINCYRLLGETKEEFAAAFRPPPIEPEGKLIQVVVKVLVTDGSLMGAQAIA